MTVGVTVPPAGAESKKPTVIEQLGCLSTSHVPAPRPTTDEEDLRLGHATPTCQKV